MGTAGMEGARNAEPIQLLSMARLEGVGGSSTGIHMRHMQPTAADTLRAVQATVEHGTPQRRLRRKITAARPDDVQLGTERLAGKTSKFHTAKSKNLLIKHPMTGDAGVQMACHNTTYNWSQNWRPKI